MSRNCKKYVFHVHFYLKYGDNLCNHMAILAHLSFMKKSQAQATTQYQARTALTLKLWE